MIFSLKPFSPLNNLQINGTITRQTNQLNINYQLTGNLAAIEIPTPTDTPTRKHELWQATCFEFFLAIPNSPNYWEFNLSPAGNWNIYRFDNYRQGMREENVITSLPFSVQIQPQALSLEIELNLAEIALTEQSLEVAITSVIKHSNGEITYWALTHPGGEADFHRRDSFILSLA